MNRDRQQLDADRRKAAQFYLENYTREQRYLRIFERDFTEYLASENWLRTPEAKEKQKYFDFLISFESLKERMKEFRWSKEFLQANGIDFKKLKSLYFALA